ncbi:MAG: pyruvate kinase, partial [Acidimicrobiaceae bacterium]|nr:pyruvate kinase [Acidimicrobiaceae bacterium]
GVFPEGGVFLAEGATVQLVSGVGMCTAERVEVDYPSLIHDLRAGDTVILGDGAITLKVRATHAEAAEAVVITGGRVQGRPGVHIPSERLRLRTPTEEDLELLEVMCRVGVDFVAVSFVRSARDIEIVRAAAGAHGPDLVAKIETAPAIADLPAILECADAVMVARGDLGIECALEDVPHLQKRIIHACVAAGVPVITATQMLESMVQSPAPTRAEVSDVANAVFDGTDAVMLSAETAIGSDPVNVVRTMARICERAEQEERIDGWRDPLAAGYRDRDPSVPISITRAITHAASQAAHDAGVRAIVCCTESGTTARAMSRYRPHCQLIGASPNDHTVQTLSLAWGVHPMRVDHYHTTDEMVWCAVEASVQAGHVTTGDLIAVLAGAPDRAANSTDVLRIVRIN